MITFQQFQQIITKGCEIWFCVNDSEKFISCFMGKEEKENTKEELYWFGLTEDNQNAFDFTTFNEFASAKVFDGKSLSEIWSNITLLQINGLNPTDALKMYF